MEYSKQNYKRLTLVQHVTINVLISIVFFILLPHAQKLALFSTNHYLRFIIYIVINILFSLLFLKLINSLYRIQKFSSIVFLNGNKRSLVFCIIYSISLFVAIMVLFILTDIFFFKAEFTKLITFGNIYSFIYSFIITASSVFFEDLLFWGALTHLFVIRNKRLMGILISGVLFGMSHTINLIGNVSLGIDQVLWILNLMLGGILFAFLYTKFGLISPFIVHLLWNQLWGTNMKLAESSISFTISVILVLLYLYVRLRLRNNIKINNKNIPV